MKNKYFQSYKLQESSIIDNSKTQSKIINKMFEYSKNLIKFHNENLIPKKYDYLIHPQNNQWIYITITTSPNTNHPYIIFANISTNIINMLIPYGNEEKQVSSSLQDIQSIISLCSSMEIYALYLSVLKSITLRKSAILDNDQYNLLKCENITNCVKKKNEIKKMKETQKYKVEMMKEYEIYYKKKAIVFLKIYFDLLTNQNYSNARDFLKGTTGKYFGKQRLNTFFKNSKTIIGHLHIFIPLYELGAFLASKI